MYICSQIYSGELDIIITTTTTIIIILQIIFIFVVVPIEVAVSYTSEFETFILRKTMKSEQKV